MVMVMMVIMMVIMINGDYYDGNDNGYDGQDGYGDDSGVTKAKENGNKAKESTIKIKIVINDKTKK